ncbi:isopentenyl pyrophosphate isomerase [Paenibacillus beijingensis]|uniref:Isopentenyl-diphosphate delta-isomerase n=2 Tax=Paenibacillus beijingensis TaxID=1126833 RepID=A0A0D5NSD6_9BACL|nr:type 2 isopentenyl-diphosphate Delta-isomerase [Paenibacillus beijingensis]AJY77813.1 isopentenyl pyrophosphate isomerase [Paenibacillus beijingensis]
MQSTGGKQVASTSNGGDSGALTSARKGEHIRICLEEEVQGSGIETGFGEYRFRHNALPELNFEQISLQAEFLGRPLRAPFLVSSMTGGTNEAETINRSLAEAAQTCGWAIGLGSMRAAAENPALASTFRIRKDAPSVPVIANLGAVQLNYGFGADECLRLVELAEADALVLHLNSMQEVFQPEGDTDFSGLLKRIAQLCRSMPVPVGVKEVGWGITAETAELLAGAGAAFIDVAGAGGTSWSQVEKKRGGDAVRRQAADAFADWGVPTAQCVREVRQCLPGVPLIASGGLQSGVDAAKAIALGADLAGFGRALLPRAVHGSAASEALIEQFRRIEFELRAAMFGIGAADLGELRNTDRLVRKQ